MVALLPDIVDAGFDILNPVQCSAAGMDPRTLKERFGAQITFWGGGVDTQKTLPFGTPEEIRRAGAGADRDLRPRRRVRLQHGPQRPGRHPGREPRGPVRGRAGNTVGIRHSERSSFAAGGTSDCEARIRGTRQMGGFLRPAAGPSPLLLAPASSGNMIFCIRKPLLKWGVFP